MLASRLVRCGAVAAVVALLTGCADSGVSMSRGELTATTWDRGDRLDTRVTRGGDEVILELRWANHHLEFAFTGSEPAGLPTEHRPGVDEMNTMALAMVGASDDSFGFEGGSGSGNWGGGNGCNVLPPLPPCYEAACNRHDACWCQNGCGYDSWLHLWGTCHQCNVDVVADFLICGGAFSGSGVGN